MTTLKGKALKGRDAFVCWEEESVRNPVVPARLVRFKGVPLDYVVVNARLDSGGCSRF